MATHRSGERHRQMRDRTRYSQGCSARLRAHTWTQAIAATEAEQRPARRDTKSTRETRRHDLDAVHITVTVLGGERIRVDAELRDHFNWRQNRSRQPIHIDDR